MTLTDTYYANMADRMGDTHVADVLARNRARARHATRFTVSDGLHPMSKGWARYHPGQEPVQVLDAWGKPRWITPNQYAIYRAFLTLREKASMSRISASLGVATSTVSRALARLASLGLIAYDVKRGRYGGIERVMAAGKDLEARAQRAWERLKAARIKREARWYDRLERSGYPMLRPYLGQGATLKVPDLPWTAQDMIEAGL